MNRFDFRGQGFELSREFSPEVQAQSPDPRWKFNRNFIIFVVIALITNGVIYFGIPDWRIKKRDASIERIKERTPKPKYNYEDACVAYELLANESGWYPCFDANCEGGMIWLNKGEVWKYGKTCLEEEGRYPQGPPYGLSYQEVYRGTEQESLIRERELIYAYPLLAESIARGIVLVRPPGNKRDS